MASVEDIKTALRIVIDYLDDLMEESPTQELADLSNGLEATLLRLGDPEDFEE